MLINQTHGTVPGGQVAFWGSKKGPEKWKAVVLFSLNPAVVNLSSALLPVSLLASSYNHSLNQENNYCGRKRICFGRNKFRYVIWLRSMSYFNISISEV